MYEVIINLISNHINMIIIFLLIFINNLFIFLNSLNINYYILYGTVIYKSIKRNCTFF